MSEQVDSTRLKSGTESANSESNPPNVSIIRLHQPWRIESSTPVSSQRNSSSADSEKTNYVETNELIDESMKISPQQGEEVNQLNPRSDDLQTASPQVSRICTDKTLDVHVTEHSVTESPCPWISGSRDGSATKTHESTLQTTDELSPNIDDDSTKSVTEVENSSARITRVAAETKLTPCVKQADTAIASTTISCELVTKTVQELTTEQDEGSARFETDKKPVAASTPVPCKQPEGGSAGPSAVGCSSALTSEDITLREAGLGRKEQVEDQEQAFASNFPVSTTFKKPMSANVSQCIQRVLNEWNTKQAITSSVKDTLHAAAASVKDTLQAKTSSVEDTMQDDRSKDEILDHGVSQSEMATARALISLDSPVVFDGVRSRNSTPIMNPGDKVPKIETPKDHGNQPKLSVFSEIWSTDPMPDTQNGKSPDPALNASSHVTMPSEAVSDAMTGSSILSTASSLAGIPTNQALLDTLDEDHLATISLNDSDMATLDPAEVSRFMSALAEQSGTFSEVLDSVITNDSPGRHSDNSDDLCSIAARSELPKNQRTKIVVVDSEDSCQMEVKTMSGRHMTISKGPTEFVAVTPSTTKQLNPGVAQRVEGYTWLTDSKAKGQPDSPHMYPWTAPQAYPWQLAPLPISNSKKEPVPDLAKKKNRAKKPTTTAKESAPKKRGRPKKIKTAPVESHNETSTPQTKMITSSSKKTKDVDFAAKRVNTSAEVAAAVASICASPHASTETESVKPNNSCLQAENCSMKNSVQSLENQSKEKQNSGDAHKHTEVLNISQNLPILSTSQIQNCKAKEDSQNNQQQIHRYELPQAHNITTQHSGFGNIEEKSLRNTHYKVQSQPPKQVIDLCRPQIRFQQYQPKQKAIDLSQKNWTSAAPGNAQSHFQHQSRFCCSGSQIRPNLTCTQSMGPRVCIRNDRNIVQVQRPQTHWMHHSSTEVQRFNQGFNPHIHRFQRPVQQFGANNQMMQSDFNHGFRQLGTQSQRNGNQIQHNDQTGRQHCQNQPSPRQSENICILTKPRTPILTQQPGNSQISALRKELEKPIGIPQTKIITVDPKTFMSKQMHSHTISPVTKVQTPGRILDVNDKGPRSSLSTLPSVVKEPSIMNKQRISDGESRPTKIVLVNKDISKVKTSMPCVRKVEEQVNSRAPELKASITTKRPDDVSKSEMVGVQNPLINVIRVSMPPPIMSDQASSSSQGTTPRIITFYPQTFTQSASATTKASLLPEVKSGVSVSATKPIMVVTTAQSEQHGIVDESRPTNIIVVDKDSEESAMTSAMTKEAAKQVNSGTPKVQIPVDAKSQDSETKTRLTVFKDPNTNIITVCKRPSYRAGQTSYDNKGSTTLNSIDPQKCSRAASTNSLVSLLPDLKQVKTVPLPLKPKTKLKTEDIQRQFSKPYYMRNTIFKPIEPPKNVMSESSVSSRNQKSSGAIIVPQRIPSSMANKAIALSPSGVSSIDETNSQYDTMSCLFNQQVDNCPYNQRFTSNTTVTKSALTVTACTTAKVLSQTTPLTSSNNPLGIRLDPPCIPAFSRISIPLPVTKDILHPVLIPMPALASRPLIFRSTRSDLPQQDDDSVVVSHGADSCVPEIVITRALQPIIPKCTPTSQTVIQTAKTPTSLNCMKNVDSKNNQARLASNARTSLLPSLHSTPPKFSIPTSACNYKTITIFNEPRPSTQTVPSGKGLSSSCGSVGPKENNEAKALASIVGNSAAVEANMTRCPRESHNDESITPDDHMELKNIITKVLHAELNQLALDLPSCSTNERGLSSSSVAESSNIHLLNTPEKSSSPYACSTARKSINAKDTGMNGKWMLIRIDVDNETSKSSPSEKAKEDSIQYQLSMIDFPDSSDDECEMLDAQRNENSQVNNWSSGMKRVLPVKRVGDGLSVSVDGIYPLNCQDNQITKQEKVITIGSGSTIWQKPSRKDVLSAEKTFFMPNKDDEVASIVPWSTTKIPAYVASSFNTGTILSTSSQRDQLDKTQSSIEAESFCSPNAKRFWTHPTVLPPKFRKANRLSCARCYERISPEGLCHCESRQQQLMNSADQSSFKAKRRLFTSDDSASSNDSATDSKCYNNKPKDDEKVNSSKDAGRKGVFHGESHCIVETGREEVTSTTCEPENESLDETLAATGGPLYGDMSLPDIEVIVVSKSMMDDEDNDLGEVSSSCQLADKPIEKPTILQRPKEQNDFKEIKNQERRTEEMNSVKNPEDSFNSQHGSIGVIQVSEDPGCLKVPSEVGTMDNFSEPHIDESFCDVCDSSLLTKYSFIAMCPLCRKSLHNDKTNHQSQIKDGDNQKIVDQLNESFYDVDNKSSVSPKSNSRILDGRSRHLRSHSTPKIHKSTLQEGLMPGMRTLSGTLTNWDDFDQDLEPWEESMIEADPVKKKKAGRPKGSKNKKKHQYWLEDPLCKSISGDFEADNRADEVLRDKRHSISDSSAQEQISKEKCGPDSNEANRKTSTKDKTQLRALHSRISETTDGTPSMKPGPKGNAREKKLNKMWKETVNIVAPDCQSPPKCKFCLRTFRDHQVKLKHERNHVTNIGNESIRKLTPRAKCNSASLAKKKLISRSHKVLRQMSKARKHEINKLHISSNSGVTSKEIIKPLAHVASNVPSPSCGEVEESSEEDSSEDEMSKQYNLRSSVTSASTDLSFCTMTTTDLPSDLSEEDSSEDETQSQYNLRSSFSSADCSAPSSESSYTLRSKRCLDSTKLGKVSEKSKVRAGKSSVKETRKRRPSGGQECPAKKCKLIATSPKVSDRELKTTSSAKSRKKLHAKAKNPTGRRMNKRRARRIQQHRDCKKTVQSSNAKKRKLEQYAQDVKEYELAIKKRRRSQMEEKKSSKKTKAKDESSVQPAPKRSSPKKAANTTSSSPRTAKLANSSKKTMAGFSPRKQYIAKNMGSGSTKCDASKSPSNKERKSPSSVVQKGQGAKVVNKSCKKSTSDHTDQMHNASSKGKNLDSKKASKQSKKGNDDPRKKKDGQIKHKSPNTKIANSKSHHAKNVRQANDTASKQTAIPSKSKASNSKTESPSDLNHAQTAKTKNKTNRDASSKANDGLKKRKRATSPVKCEDVKKKNSAKHSPNKQGKKCNKQKKGKTCPSKSESSLKSNMESRSKSQMSFKEWKAQIFSDDVLSCDDSESNLDFSAPLVMECDNISEASGTAECVNSSQTLTSENIFEAMAALERTNWMANKQLQRRRVDKTAVKNKGTSSIEDDAGEEKKSSDPITKTKSPKGVEDLEELTKTPRKVDEDMDADDRIEQERLECEKHSSMEVNTRKRRKSSGRGNTTISPAKKIVGSNRKTRNSLCRNTNDVGDELSRERRTSFNLKTSSNDAHSTSDMSVDGNVADEDDDFENEQDTAADTSVISVDGAWRSKASNSSETKFGSTISKAIDDQKASMDTEAKAKEIAKKVAAKQDPKKEICLIEAPKFYGKGLKYFISGHGPSMCVKGPYTHPPDSRQGSDDSHTNPDMEAVRPTSVFSDESKFSPQSEDDQSSEQSVPNVNFQLRRALRGREIVYCDLCQRGYNGYYAYDKHEQTVRHKSLVRAQTLGIQMAQRLAGGEAISALGIFPTLVPQDPDPDVTGDLPEEADSSAHDAPPASTRCSKTPKGAVSKKRVSKAKAKGKMPSTRRSAGPRKAAGRDPDGDEDERKEPGGPSQATDKSPPATMSKPHAMSSPPQGMNSEAVMFSMFKDFMKQFAENMWKQSQKPEQTAGEGNHSQQDDNGQRHDPIEHTQNTKNSPTEKAQEPSQSASKCTTPQEEEDTSLIFNNSDVCFDALSGQLPDELLGFRMPHYPDSRPLPEQRSHMNLAQSDLNVHSVPPASLDSSESWYSAITQSMDVIDNIPPEPTVCHIGNSFSQHGGSSFSGQNLGFSNITGFTSPPQHHLRLSSRQQSPGPGSYDHGMQGLLWSTPAPSTHQQPGYLQMLNDSLEGNMTEHSSTRGGNFLGESSISTDIAETPRHRYVTSSNPRVLAADLNGLGPANSTPFTVGPHMGRSCSSTVTGETQVQHVKSPNTASLMEQPSNIASSMSCSNESLQSSNKNTNLAVPNQTAALEALGATRQDKSDSAMKEGVSELDSASLNDRPEVANVSQPKEDMEGADDETQVLN